MDEWVPLGMDSESLEALTDGVPPWLHHSIWGWITNALYSGDSKATELVRLYDRKTCRRQPLFPAINALGLPGLKQELNEDETLRFVDFLVGHGLYVSDYLLDALLLEGGSLWTVGERMGRAGLVRRVPEGVQLAAVDTIQQSARAGAFSRRRGRPASGWTRTPRKRTRRRSSP